MAPATASRVSGLAPLAEIAVKKTAPSAAKAVLFAALIAGTIDVGAASLINGLNPVVILQAIASGVLGKQSFFDGTASAVLGLLLQWAMALLIAGAYVAAGRRRTWLTRRWIAGGALYGCVVFAVMNYLVVPLSAAWPPHPLDAETVLHRFPPDKFAENFAAMILFGLIVAFFAHRYGTRGHTDAADSPVEATDKRAAG